MAFNFDLTTPTEEEDGVRLGGIDFSQQEEGEQLGFNKFDKNSGTTLGFDLAEDAEEPLGTLNFSLDSDEQLGNSSYSSSAAATPAEPPVQLTSLGEDYSIGNLAKHDGIAQLASSVLEDRGEGKKKEGETNEELIERYISHMRYVEHNTMDVMQEVDYVKDLSEPKKQKYTIMKGIYEQMPNFAEEGGGNALSGTLDIVGAYLTDPVLLAGLVLGVGTGGASAAAAIAARQSGKAVLSRAVMGHMLKGNIGRITASTTLEGLGGAMHESQRQELDIEIGRLKEKDWGSVALVGGLSAGLSLVGAGVGAAVTVGKKATGIATNAERTLARLAAAKQGDDVAIAAGKEARGAGIDPITGAPLVTFDKEAAERIRDALSMPTAELSPQVNRDIMQSTIAVAENLMELLPSKYFRQTIDGQKEKMADTVLRIVSQASEINDDVFEQALRRTGLEPAEFVQVSRLGIHESGAAMQLYSTMAKKIELMAGNNPELKAKLAKLYGKDNEIGTARGTFWGFLKRLDRESRALMVTQVATTARNVISAAGAVTFGAAAKLVEGTMVHSYNSIAGALSGNAARIPFKTGMMQTLDEATGAFRAIMGHRESMDLAKMMLKDNSRLSQTLFRSLQETGNETLTKTTRFMNGLNMMQDQVIRSGVFTDSVNRQMKKLDLNMYDYIANNKPIPTQVLTKATDDALEATFALMPHKGTVLRTFVDAAESIPFATTFVFPFARFMADAMAFQYKYSPANFLNAAGAFRSGKAISKKAGKKFAEAEEKRLQSTLAPLTKDKSRLKYEAKNLKREGQELSNIGSRAMQDSADRVAKGVVGSGLLYAAVLYRNDNQDIAWNTVANKNQPDQPIDIRAVFPMAPYLAVADLMVKWNNNELQGVDSAAQLLEGLTGTMLRPMGLMDSVNDLIETITEVTSEGEATGDVVTKEKLGKIMGNWAGSIMGRPLTSSQIFRDIYAAFDDSEAIVRETRMVDGEGMGGVFVHTFLNHIKSKIPVWQKDLPEYRSPTTGGTVRRQSAVMAQFTGVKYMPKQNEVEKELVNLGLASYKLTPRTGNKQADYLAKKHMAVYANTIIQYQMASPLYKSLSKTDKRTTIENRFIEIRKMALEVAKGEAMMMAFRQGKSYSVFDEGKWAKTPKRARELADEYFRNYYGRSVSELGVYAAGSKIGIALKKGM